MQAVSGHPSAPIASVSPRAAAAHVEAGTAWIVDVRETDEYRREHVAGSALCPTSVVAPQDLPAPQAGRSMLVLCRSGGRAGRVVQALRALGRSDAMVIEGGIVAWQNAGLPIVRHAAAPISIMRQVMITVGVLGMGFTALAAFVSPWWLLGTGALGAGLLFAGATGMCAMAAVLGKMPWNASSKVGVNPGKGSLAAGGTACSGGSCGSCG